MVSSVSSVFPSFLKLFSMYSRCQSFLVFFRFFSLIFPKGPCFLLGVNSPVVFCNKALYAANSNYLRNCCFYDNTGGRRELLLKTSCALLLACRKKLLIALKKIFEKKV